MFKHFVNEVEVSEEEFNSQLEDAIRQDTEIHYDDILDECYEPVKIGCCTFYASQILKNCDPVAYNCGIDDEVYYRLDDAMWNFKYDYEDTFFGIEFKVEDVDDEEEEENE